MTSDQAPGFFDRIQGKHTQAVMQAAERKLQAEAASPVPRPASLNIWQ